MKTLFLTVSLLFTGLQLTLAQAKLPVSATTTTKEEQEVLALSKTKWAWMADKDVAALNGLFKDNSVFVHMGGSWGKDQELSVIKGGMIWYKKAEVYAASVNMFDSTAILLNDIDLVAVVGGKEVINPFMVTEVYLKEEGQWKLGSLTFSHLARPVKLNAPASASPAQR
ncbi:nuclear transport factor 2 family protein [Hymenobacter guriensis]|uniref:Nuclear transport factor 2 family protein n=1 Tax=Hymenobacter guriensis TaxID=2793065 RepID=A0ABS0L4R9_9BACT|nr:nuclear transport factor 2 family protein [Hymenobacter guriensis]MBG8555087.1 nuclear transport factor 2 family protein [Hymenobacter guriensis]